MQNSETPEGLNPDERCIVCGDTRENHGDKRHQFNALSDQLIPLPDPPKRREEPPRARNVDKDEPGSSPESRAFATLVEVLAEKEILTTKDVIRIFRGEG